MSKTTFFCITINMIMGIVNIAIASVGYANSDVKCIIYNSLCAIFSMLVAILVALVNVRKD